MPDFNKNLYINSESFQDPLAKKDLEIALLKEKLSKYEAAANGANDGLWDWDFKKEVGFVSVPWKTMLGIDPDEQVEGPGIELWYDLLHPDDRDRAISRFNDYIAGNIHSYKEVFRMRHRDGNYRWVLSKAKVIYDDEGTVSRISGSHTDITEQKEAADAIRKSEQKYRNLFQNSLIAILRYHSRTGNILEANDRFWDLLGAENAEKKKSIDEIFVSEKDKRFIIQRIEKNGALDNYELQVKTYSGAPLWVSFSAVLYEDEEVCECILKDITQTKENLLELQKVNFELDSFVYHASHDLRSPLRSILGLISLYRIETDKDIQKECIDKIEGSVHRLDDLVVELLSISRNDRVNDAITSVNLMVEINNSISSYYNASNTTGLEIRTRIKQPFLLKSDLTRVRIILNNLISNAIKYRSFQKERSYIQLEVEVTEKAAVIKVEDNGEGIAESKLPHIFDMFYRATEKSEGSGLGLYIVKKVAEKLGATVEVQSQELEGSTFIVTIPNNQ